MPNVPRRLHRGVPSRLVQVVTSVTGLRHARGAEYKRRHERLLHNLVSNLSFDALPVRHVIWDSPTVAMTMLLRATLTLLTCAVITLPLLRSFSLSNDLVLVILSLSVPLIPLWFTLRIWRSESPSWSGAPIIVWNVHACCYLWFWVHPVCQPVHPTWLYYDIGIWHLCVPYLFSWISEY